MELNVEQETLRELSARKQVDPSFINSSIKLNVDTIKEVRTNKLRIDATIKYTLFNPGDSN